MVEQASRDDRDRSRYSETKGEVRKRAGGLQGLRNSSKGSQGRERSEPAEWRASSRLETETVGDEGTSDNSWILALCLWAW